MSTQSLVFIFRDETQKEVLLGYKQRGFGKCCYNGFGGKLKAGENIDECAIREVEEECKLNIELKDLKNLGFIRFHIGGEVIQVQIYKCCKFSGIPEVSDEMIPKWFNVSHLPDKMLVDTKLWFPNILNNSKFEMDIEKTMTRVESINLKFVGKYN